MAGEDREEELENLLYTGALWAVTYGTKYRFFMGFCIDFRHIIWYKNSGK